MDADHQPVDRWHEDEHPSLLGEPGRTSWLGLLAIVTAAALLIAGCWPRMVTPPEVPATVAAVEPGGFLPRVLGALTGKVAADAREQERRETFGVLRTWGNWCVAAGILTAVISIFARGWIPIGSSITCGLFGLGLLVAREFLERAIGPVVWVGVILTVLAAVAVAAVLGMALVKWLMARHGKYLMARGTTIGNFAEVREGAAVVATALGLTSEKPKVRKKRKAILPAPPTHNKGGA